MRTTLTIADDVHEFVAYYARSRGLTLSAAVTELLRKAEYAPTPEPQIARSASGFPTFRPVKGAAKLSVEIVKKLEEEAFDPSLFT